EGCSFRRLQVPVEVPREDALERPVRERQCEGVTLHVGRFRCLLARDFDHRWTLVESDDLPRQMPGQEAGSAGDVERACGWQLCDRGLEQLELRQEAVV